MCVLRPCAHIRRYGFSGGLGLSPSTISPPLSTPRAHTHRYGESGGLAAVPRRFKHVPPPDLDDPTGALSFGGWVGWVGSAQTSHQTPPGSPRPTPSCSPPPAGAPPFPAGRGLAVAVLVRLMPSPGGLGWEHLGLVRRALTVPLTFCIPSGRHGRRPWGCSQPRAAPGRRSLRISGARSCGSWGALV